MVWIFFLGIIGMMVAKPKSAFFLVPIGLFVLLGVLP